MHTDAIFTGNHVLKELMRSVFYRENKNSSSGNDPHFMTVGDHKIHLILFPSMDNNHHINHLCLNLCNLNHEPGL